MRTNSSNIRKKRTCSGWLLAISLGIGLCAVAAKQPLASNGFDDPFDTSGANWMSVEHYADKTARFPQAEEPEEEIENTENAESAENSETETQKTASNPPAPTVATEQPAPVQPERPLNFPILPALNQGYGLSVTSTQEENLVEDEKVAEPTRPLNLPVMPGTGRITEKQDKQIAGESENATEGMDEKKWKDARTVAKKTARKNAEEKQMPINVRLATLPDEKTKAVPGAPIIRPRKAGTETVAAKPAPKPKAPEAEKKNAEACAALTAYRKKQLEAIESDRKTLNALQAAISELGLDKELDFMTGASKNLSMPVKPTDDPKTAPKSSQTRH